jgi:hypothetical protein
MNLCNTNLWKQVSCWETRYRHFCVHELTDIIIISGAFDVTDQLMIRFFAFVRYWRKNGSTMRQYISYSQTSRKPTIQLGGKYCPVLRD